jgi:hypothetical protein
MSDGAPTIDPALAAALAQLRDYRLPEPVSWWPPAPGWWALLLLLAALALWLLWRVRRQLARTAATRQARRELARLRARCASGDDNVACVREVSVLLRRFALARWPRQQVAGLSGSAWLAFLDAHGGNGRFSNGAGRHLADAPYRPRAAVPLPELLDLADDWIRHNRGDRG